MGAVAVALGVAGCAGSASNPPCADSGCGTIVGAVQTCDRVQPRHCRTARVDAVALLDDHRHFVQRAPRVPGDPFDGQFTFKGVNPGHYILRTRARGRSWTRQVQAPVNSTVHADITIQPR